MYLHTGDADIAVAPYTTDADVAIDPARLGASPLIEAAMRGGGFQPGANPGSWVKEDIGAPSRTEDKDALDVLRLLRSVEADRLGRRVRLLLESTLAGETASEAISHFRSLFGTPESPGSNLAARAVTGLDDPDTIRASCAALAEELLTALGK